MKANLKMENIKEVFEVVKTASRRYPFAGDPDDLTQLVIQKLLSSKSVRNEVARSYVIQTVKNTALDLYRQTKRKRNHEVLTSNSMFHDADNERLHITYEAILGRNDEEIDYFMLDGIRRSLLGLSKSHRQTLLLCAEGYSYLEIAALTGAGIGTVRSRLHYARAFMARTVSSL